MSEPSVWNKRTYYVDSYGDDDGERTAYELKSTKQLRAALAEGADPNERNALHEAVGKGSTTQVKALLKAGADTERIGEAGLTALQTAIFAGQQDKFDALVREGADIDATVPERIELDYSGEVIEPDHLGHTPSMMAARGGHVEMLAQLKDKGASMKGVLHAAVMGDIELMEQRERGWGADSREPLTPKLVEQGMDINQPFDLSFVSDSYRSRAEHYDCRHSTPLHLAAKAGQVEVIKMLIDLGADTEARDQFERTPLFETHEQEAMEVLIDAGADVNARDAEGNTPLHHVWREDIAQLLIDAGADVLAQNEHGLLPAQREEGVYHRRADKLIQTIQNRVRLENIARRAQGQDSDLATPEQALAARQARYGRAM